MTMTTISPTLLFVPGIHRLRISYTFLFTRNSRSRPVSHRKQQGTNRKRICHESEIIRAFGVQNPYIVRAEIQPFDTHQTLDA